MKKLFFAIIFLICCSSFVSATEINVAGYTSNVWRFGGNSAKMRVYLDRRTVTTDGKVLNPSIVGLGGWYKEIDCTVSGTNLSCSPFVIDSTVDSSNPNAKYSFIFFDANNKRRDDFVTVKVPASPLTTTFGALLLYNQTSIPAVATTYTKGEIDTILAGLTDASVRASETALGVTSLTVAPTDSADPRAVGDNDPRVGGKLLSKYTDLASAVADIGTAATNLTVDSAVTISVNQTIPKNIRVLFGASGAITVDAGKVLTIENGGEFQAPLRQVFGGLGLVKFTKTNPRQIFPEWFGAVPNDNDSTVQTANVKAINAAISSAAVLRSVWNGTRPAGTDIFFHPGNIYYLNASIEIINTTGVTLTTNGHTGSAELQWTQGINGATDDSGIKIISSFYIGVENLFLHTTNPYFTGTILEIGTNGADPSYIDIDNLTIWGAFGAGGAIPYTTANAISLKHALATRITRNTIMATTVGIYTDPNSARTNGIHVSDNIFSTTTGLINGGEGWVVSNNIFETNQYGQTIAVDHTSEGYVWGYKFIGNWIGDSIAGGGTSIKLRCRGCDISGNKIQNYGGNGSKWIEILAASYGITITANQFQAGEGDSTGTASAIHFQTGGVASLNILITGNDLQFPDANTVTGNYNNYVIHPHYPYMTGRSNGNTFTHNEDNVFNGATTMTAPVTLGSTLTVAGTTNFNFVTNFNGTGMFNSYLVANYTLEVGSGGTPITNVLSASASLDYATAAANTCEVKTLTVPGAITTATSVSLGLPNALVAHNTTSIFTEWISAANTVSVRRCVITADGSDPAAATVRATVTGFLY